MNVDHLPLGVEKAVELADREFGLALVLAYGIHGGLQELPCADSGEFHRVLHGKEDALAGAVFGEPLGYVLTVVEYRAGGNSVLGPSCDNVGERALARAVRPHDGVNLALVNG